MRAVGSKVLIRKLSQDEKTAGGLILPPNAKDPNVCKGKVVSVAVQYVENGQTVAAPFYEGEHVGFFIKNAVKIDGEVDLYFTDISNVIYVIEEAPCR